jgi:bacteriorhodopsin
MNWILIVVVVAILLIFYSKSHHMRHKISYYLVILGVAFILISAYVAYTYNIDPTKVDDLGKMGKIYLSWLVNVGKNVGKVTGYAVHQNWSLKALNFSTAG